MMKARELGLTVEEKSTQTRAILAKIKKLEKEGYEFEAADASFELLVLDAFSSDAIPLHLVTREALALYRRKLTPTGLLACHISNLHLDLEPVFARLARDAGWSALTRDDTDDATTAATPGKSPSIWLVMARHAEELAPLARDPRWQPAREVPALAVWTDDHSSLLPVFRWR